MSVLLSLTRASVRFGGVPVLRHCSAHIHAGERVALVGSNGSGKSTLLRTLHGLLPLAEGCLQAALLTASDRPVMLASTGSSEVISEKAVVKLSVKVFMGCKKAAAL